jgi:hypothetical protein
MAMVVATSDDDDVDDDHDMDASLNFDDGGTVDVVVHVAVDVIVDVVDNDLSEVSTRTSTGGQREKCVPPCSLKVAPMSQ